MERTYTVTTKSVEDLLKEGYEVTWSNKYGMWDVSGISYMETRLGTTFPGCTKADTIYLDLDGEPIFPVKHVEPEFIKGDAVKAWDSDASDWVVGVYIGVYNGKYKVQRYSDEADIYEHVAFLEPHDYL